MSCRRAQDIDLAGFLLDPLGPEFDDFRSHYPGCEACAGEVARWSELEQGLGALGSAHPEPEDLARYASARAEGGRLEATLREEIDAHLQTCTPCREELRALRAWAPASATAATGAEPMAPVAPWWRRGAFRPALASLLLGILLLPVLFVAIPDGPLAPGVQEMASTQAVREQEPVPDEDVPALANRPEPRGAREEAAPLAAADAARPASPPPLRPSIRESAPAPKAVVEADEQVEAFAAGRVAPAPAGPAERAPSSADFREVPAAAPPAPVAPQDPERRMARARSAPAFEAAAESDAALGSALESNALVDLAGPEATSSLDRARAASFLRVKLPAGFGAGRAVVTREAPVDAKRLDATSAFSRKLEAGPAGDERWIRVPLSPGSFPEAGTYRVEVFSVDEPDRPPRVFRVHVRAEP